MSGGRYEYIQHRIDDVAEDIENIIKTNHSKELNEYGDEIGRHFSRDTLENMVIGLAIIKMAAVYIHRIDYLMSGDDGEESFKRRLRGDLEKLKNYIP